MAVQADKLKNRKKLPQSQFLERQQKAKEKGKNNRNTLDQGEKWRCVCCGTKYTTQDTHFLRTSSKLYAFWNYFVPICRPCLDVYWDDVVMPKFGYDDKMALKYMCAVLDWEWSERAYETTKKRISAQPANSMLPTYAAQRQLIGATKIDGYTFADTLKKYFTSVLAEAESAEDCESQSVAQDEHKEVPEAQNNQTEDEEEVLNVDEAVIARFGHGYSQDEYDFLESEYNDWISRYDCQTKAQEELFKNLCFAQLNTRRYQRAGDGRRASESMEMSQKLMDTAKITPKQDKGDQLAATNTFGTLIKQWENEQPIPEPAPEWADVDGIRRYISTWFLGHLCKMFKIDNDVTQLYDEELGAYTVEPPQFADDDDNGMAEEFGDIFGSSIKNLRIESDERDATE